MLPLQSLALRRGAAQQQRLVCRAALVTAPPTPPAAPAAPAAELASSSAAERAAFAESVGYRSVGADLPSNVTLTDVISSLPKEVRLGHFFMYSRCSMWPCAVPPT